MIAQAPLIEAPISIWQQRAHKAGLWLTVLTGAIIPLSTSLTEIFTTLVGVLWLAAGHYKNLWSQVRSHPLVRSSLLLYAALGVGVLYTEAAMPDWLGMLRKYRELLLVVVFMTFLDSAWARKAALKAFGAAMVVTLLASFYKFYLVPASLDPNLRVGLPFKNSITHSLLMAVFAFGLVTHVFHHRDDKGTVWKLSALLAVAIFNLFFMVDGRTGYVVFYLLGLLFLFQKFRFRVAVAGLVLLAGFHFILSSTSTLYQSQWNHLSRGVHKYLEGDTNSSIGMRIEFSRTSYEIMMQSPWVGHGTGSFRDQYREFGEARGLERITVNPHNEYMMLGVQLGFLGIGLLLYFMYTLWRYAFALEPLYRKLAQGLALTVTAGCFANSFLMDHTEGTLIMFLTSVLYSPLMHSSQTKHA
ncbi:O-antigen ligase family protein [Nitrospina watsonii]|uniref:Enzyme n=1 Tax=Nitrospina watsonii TaxID=1323948 RepID=A0ABN8W546_9BACT|nr:O-antigen ligase family protein [Nitrospina watsonii]CAI2719218.1 putative enzyme [Nitrospina watsonii]